jgi:hypothetical protein
MKIILSHDIDHLNWKEHYFKDLYLQGALYRNTIGLLRGDISWGLYIKRLKCWGRIHRIPEIIEFYDREELKANFFFGMDKALHLSYNYKNAKPLILDLFNKGHKVGVHGIAFNDAKRIHTEYERFKELSALDQFGIRTHYLRLDTNSLTLFDQQGYLYDSSIEVLSEPYQINNMWEFPISIMDASLVDKSQLNQDLEIWKSNTKSKIDMALKKGIPYFVINFHDLYYSSKFPIIKAWFEWLIKELKSNNFEFITFEEALIELSNKEQ